MASSSDSAQRLDDDKLHWMRLHRGARVPSRQNPEDAGYDLYAYEKSVDNQSAIFYVVPGEQVLVGTGFAVQLPKGTCGHIRPRSGLALKKSIDVHPGTIDRGYRGELRVIVKNNGTEEFRVHNGDRIAQMVVERVYMGEATVVDRLDPSERGEAGFGSTGVSEAPAAHAKGKGKTRERKRSRASKDSSKKCKTSSKRQHRQSEAASSSSSPSSSSSSSSSPSLLERLSRVRKHVGHVDKIGTIRVGQGTPYVEHIDTLTFGDSDDDNPLGMQANVGFFLPQQVVATDHGVDLKGQQILYAQRNCVALPSRYRQAWDFAKNMYKELWIDGEQIHKERIQVSQ